MNNQSLPLSSLPIPPSTLANLTKAGYETLDDLAHYNSASQLTDAFKIPLAASQALFSSSQRRSTSTPGAQLPSTQSAAAMIRSSSHKQKTNTFPTRCGPVDTLLKGGLSEGHILEISGPPGSPKEIILLHTLSSFVETGRTVIFVDCQNMCDPHRIRNHIKGIPSADQLVSYIKINNITDFMIFMHNLTSHSNFSLLAISCISFPFQSIQQNATRSHLLNQLKTILTNLCTQNITTVVTSQLATKLLDADGATVNFDTAGAKGVMVPQLGSTYLPSGKTERILVASSGPSKGFVHLLSGLPGKEVPCRAFEMGTSGRGKRMTMQDKRRGRVTSRSSSCRVA